MARSFNGSSDKITLNATISWPTAAHSISFWLNASSLTPAYQGLILDTTNTAVLIYLKSTGAFAVYAGGWSGATADPVTGGTIGTNAWHHFGITVSAGGNELVYLDGSLISTITATGGVSSTVTHVFGDDTVNAGRFFSGSLADIGFWKSIQLSAGQMSALAKGARPYQLVADFYWPLNGVASPEPDLGGAANNGTLTGTTNASGPPLMQFTPRWPQFNAVAAAPTFNPAWAMRKNIIVEGVAT